MIKSRVCKISQSESLSAYADGMLDGQAMRRLARHIDGCEDCREALDQQAGLIQLLRGVRDASPSAPQSFWADAYRTARLSVPAAERPAETAARVFGRPKRWRLVSLVAIGAATLILSLLPTGAMRGVLSQPANAAQAIDVSALVKAHANGIADEPLVDRQRVSMEVADIAAQQAGEDTTGDGFDGAGGALDGGRGSH